MEVQGSYKVKAVKFSIRVSVIVVINILNSFRLNDKQNIDVGIKCGSCKKIVKDGDYCGVWYHGCSCTRLSQDDVTMMGRISGCL